MQDFLKNIKCYIMIIKYKYSWRKKNLFNIDVTSIQKGKYITY